MSDTPYLSTVTLGDLRLRLPPASARMLRLLAGELDLLDNATIAEALQAAQQAPDSCLPYLVAAYIRMGGFVVPDPPAWSGDRTHRGAISAAGAPAPPGSGIPPGHAPAAPTPDPAVMPAADPPPEESAAEAAVRFLTDVVGLPRADAAAMTVVADLGVPERYRAESAASVAHADAAARHGRVGDGATTTALEPGERALLLQTGLPPDHLADYERDLVGAPDTHALAAFPEQAAGPGGLSRADAEALTDAGWQDDAIEAYRVILSRTPAVEVRQVPA